MIIRAIILITAIFSLSPTAICKGDSISQAPIMDSLLWQAVVRAHVLSSKGDATMKIDEVLYGEPSLVGKTFQVQTTNGDDHSAAVVFPVLKVGENAIWPVCYHHGPAYHGVDGVNNTSGIVVDYWMQAYGMNWPLRESDEEVYRKGPAIVAVLKSLKPIKSWEDINVALLRLSQNERDPYLSAWEKRFSQLHIAVP